MDKLLAGVQYVLNLGPTVILPIAILVIGLIFRTGFKKALKSGITIGIGFVGINLVIGLLVDNLGPAAQHMVERFGLNLTVIDIGWPGAAALSWASPVAAILIPVCLAVNILLIVLKATKTLDIDIWNYWHLFLQVQLVMSLQAAGGLRFYVRFFSKSQPCLWPIKWLQWCKNSMG